MARTIRLYILDVGFRAVGNGVNMYVYVHKCRLYIAASERDEIKVDWYRLNARNVRIFSSRRHNVLRIILAYSS